MRKRKLYLSELLIRSKRKNYHIYLQDGITSIYFVDINQAVEQLKETIYWKCQIKYWEVYENVLTITLY